MVAKIVIPCWFLSIIRHLVFRGPQRGTKIWTTTQVAFRWWWVWKPLKAADADGDAAFGCASRGPSNAAHLATGGDSMLQNCQVFVLTQTADECDKALLPMDYIMFTLSKRVYGTFPWPLQLC